MTSESREILTPKSESEWLDWRRKDITSTMSPALFGVSPYLTHFELWHSKKSGLDLPFNENDRVVWGKRMEPVIAAGVAEDNGWKVRKIAEYIRLPALNMGSSYDYEVECPDRGTGVMEIKNVDYFIHKNTWSKDEAPPHIEIQLQHQLETHGAYNWGCIVAFIGGNNPIPYIRERDREMGAGIRRAIAQFWKSIDDNKEPKPDFYRDGEAIRALYNPLSDIADKMDDTALAALASQYTRAQEMESFHKKEKEAAASEIIRSLGNNKGAWTTFGKISVSMVKDTQGTLVTNDMVGTYIGSRRGYPKLNVRGTQNGEKGATDSRQDQ